MLHLSPSSDFSIAVYTSAASVWEATSPFLQNRELDTHIILSLILRIREVEYLSESLRPDVAPPVVSPPHHNIWIASWHTIPYSGSKSLDLLLSFTNGSFGSHPIFIVSPSPVPLPPNALHERLQQFVARLLLHFPPQQIHSVFAPRGISQAFVRAWSEQTDILPNATPCLSAIQHASRANTLAVLLPPQSYCHFREATLADVHILALLLPESGPTPQANPSEIIQGEVTTLITQSRIFVLESAGADDEVLGLLAFGRTSTTCAEITNLYIKPEHRRRGLGTYLTWKGCQFLLEENNTRTILCFFPLGDGALQQLAARVGLLPVVEGDNVWLELGFEDAEASHW